MKISAEDSETEDTEDSNEDSVTDGDYEEEASSSSSSSSEDYVLFSYRANIYRGTLMPKLAKQISSWRTTKTKVE